MESKVKQTLKKIKLSKKEKIIVGVSGGKDSTVVAYLLKKFGYTVKGIHINLGMEKYSQDCLSAVEKLCKDLKIKLYVYDVKKEFGKSVLEIIKKRKIKGNNCVVCGVFKKYILNKKARELGADKIATGHHLDDESETVLLNTLKGSPELGANIGPITRNIKDKKFISRIKPLYFVSEKEIENYVKKLKISYVEETCPYRGETYRIEIRNFLKTLSKKDKENLLKNSEAVMKKVKKEKVINYCKKCGEPSRQNVCKFCELVKK